MYAGCAFDLLSVTVKQLAVQYCLSVDHPQTGHRHAFRTGDLDLDLIILIYELGVDILKILLLAKN